jgi:prepilin-type N-terminal cleavage/methylation domain-containing protein
VKSVNRFQEDKPAMKSLIERYRAIDTEVKDDEGFTLIELLIVVLILGILAAIVAFAVGAFTSTSAVAACNTDAKSVESAVAAYEASNNGTVPTAANLTSTANGGPYLHNFPSNSSYYNITIGTSGAVNIYLTTTDPAHKTYAYTITGTPGENYDTFTWGNTGGAATTLTGKNICAGA